MFTRFVQQGDRRQFQCQILDVIDVIQFTPTIFGSQPLDHDHINRQMWLGVIETKIEIA